MCCDNASPHRRGYPSPFNFLRCPSQSDPQEKKGRRDRPQKRTGPSADVAQDTFEPPPPSPSAGPQGCVPECRAGGRYVGCTFAAPEVDASVSATLDILGVDAGFPLDLKILMLDLRQTCLLDTSPCPTLLSFLHRVKLVPTTLCTL